MPLRAASDSRVDSTPGRTRLYQRGVQRRDKPTYRFASAQQIPGHATRRSVSGARDKNTRAG
jgi:hypothetical protein